MKKLLAVVAVSFGMTSQASVYWHGAVGQALDWFGTDSGHSYWNENEDGSGAWRGFQVGENAHVRNGGIAVVGNGVSVYGTAKLILNHNAIIPSCVRIDEGGTLSYPCIYVSHINGAGGLFHVNGGAVTVGGSSADEGLKVPSDNISYADNEGGVLVTSGSLDVFSGFLIGVASSQQNYRKHGDLTLVNGTVTAHCDVSVGGSFAFSSGAVNVSGGRFRGDSAVSLNLSGNSGLSQDGGNVAFATCVSDGAQVSLSGGAADFGKFWLKKGTRLEVSGTASLTGGLTLWDDVFKAGATNCISVSGGTLSVTNFRGWVNGVVNGKMHAWIDAENPFRFRQTGGNVSFDVIYTNPGESRDVRLAVDGGTFHGGTVAVFGQPFYFRHSGSANVSIEKLAAPTAINGNEHSVGCLVEHVIARGRMEPMRHTTAQNGGFYVFGKNIVRPDGGVQIVADDTLPLVVCEQTATPDMTYCSGTPDAALWSAGRIGNTSSWGVALSPGAGVGLLSDGRTSVFEATPFGYASLPTVKTNGLVRYAVSMRLELVCASRESIANSLADAGYGNVRVSGDIEPLVSFEVPCDYLVDGASNAKLLFDFTETACPSRFVVGEMSFPVVTNALVKSVGIEVARELKGLTVIVR